MTNLFVAAGGGGDAVGILLARRVLEPEGEGPALISTCAWERLRVDPVPGPRPITGFVGLGQRAGRNVEVLPSSDTEPPGRSTLPRLASESDTRIFLHDFESGAEGLAVQLRALARDVSAERLVVVDVGGDVTARGDEPGLLSPLADSITLAGALATTVPTSLAVVGPGADAELTEAEVINRLVAHGAEPVGLVSPADVERCAAILGWHPTEASALVAASALGGRGSVEMRRGSHPTPLTERTREVWLARNPALEDFPLALALAGTKSLRGAVDVIEGLSVNEIAYEQAKAVQLSSPERRRRRSVEEIVRRAVSNGASHITTRRLMEQANLDPTAATETLRKLEVSGRRVGGLWELDSF